MNQNILIGLERQAEKLVLQIPAALDSNEYTSLFNEKFAELIVSECANIVMEWKSEPFPIDPETAARIILEHFEVKKT